MDVRARFRDLSALSSRIDPPEVRCRFVGLRLRQADADRLGSLAGELGVGTSTMARLVIEEFIAMRGGARRRRAARSAR